MRLYRGVVSELSGVVSVGRAIRALSVFRLREGVISEWEVEV